MTVMTVFATHGQHRMIAVGEFSVKQGLLKIALRWRHALYALAEFDKVVLDELLTHAALNSHGNRCLKFQRSQASLRTP